MPINDYGYGFYCTESLDLTKKYSVLNWIAILLKFRQFDLSSDIALEAKEYLIKNFYIDISKFDVVIGYRADDSYFRFVKDFINNTISVQKLAKAMGLGMLGTQYIIQRE